MMTAAALGGACAGLAVLLAGGSGSLSRHRVRHQHPRLTRRPLRASVLRPGFVRPSLTTTRPPALPALLLGVLALGLTAGPVAAVVTAGFCVGAPRVLRARRRRAVQDLSRAQAAELCGALAAELRAGRAPADALAATAAALGGGELAELLRRVAATARLGGDVPAALRAAGGPAGVVLRQLAACWQVSTRTGAGLAGAVDRLGAGLRSQDKQRREVAAQLAGPRTTARLLAVLPVLGILLAAALGGDPLRVLLHTPVGGACLVAALLLDTAGLLWTDALVRRAMSAAA